MDKMSFKNLSGEQNSGTMLEASCSFPDIFYRLCLLHIFTWTAL